MGMIGEYLRVRLELHGGAEGSRKGPECVPCF